MTFGLNLIFSLLLLAPGLAVYCGLFLVHRSPQFRPAPPAPGSILTLSIVAFGSLAAHALGATFSASVNAGCAAFGRCVSLGFEPNIYVLVMRTAVAKLPAPPADIAAFLTIIFLLSTLTLGVTLWFANSKLGRKWLSDLLYGWLAELVKKAEPDNRYVTAFVLTKLGSEGRVVGYEGLLQNLAVNHDKEIVSISLSDCTTFLIAIGTSSLRRIPIVRPSPIPNLFIAKPEIENIAFNVFEQS